MVPLLLACRAGLQDADDIGHGIANKLSALHGHPLTPIRVDADLTHPTQQKPPSRYAYRIHVKKRHIFALKGQSTHACHRQPASSNYDA
jgi:hypothetical protein